MPSFRQLQRQTAVSNWPFFKWDCMTSEISRVLAKRLFTKIDESVAKETADLYREMYRKIKDKGLKPVDITPDFI
jgi:hypothetical protein